MEHMPHENYSPQHAKKEEAPKSDELIPGLEVTDFDVEEVEPAPEIEDPKQMLH